MQALQVGALCKSGPVNSGRQMQSIRSYFATDLRDARSDREPALNALSGGRSVETSRYRSKQASKTCFGPNRVINMVSQLLSRSFKRTWRDGQVFDLVLSFHRGEKTLSRRRHPVGQNGPNTSAYKSGRRNYKPASELQL